MINRLSQHVKTLHARQQLRRQFNAYVGQPVRTHAVDLGLAVAASGWAVRETRYSADFDTPILREIMKKAFENGLSFSAHVPFTSAVAHRQPQPSYSSHAALQAHIDRDRDGVFRIKRFTISKAHPG